jgi:uncharacterized protein (DUF952 family)
MMTSACNDTPHVDKRGSALYRPLMICTSRTTDDGFGMTPVYKIAPLALWRAAEEAGAFTGAPVDVADGFIHFSTREQLAETATRHFSGQRNLMLIAIDAARLGAALVYEPSRGGALFPHLYGPLPLAACLWSAPLPLRTDGVPDLAAVPELQGDSQQRNMR